MKCNWSGNIILISVGTGARTGLAFCTGTKEKYIWWFAIYYIMTISCLKETGPPSSKCDSDGDDNTNFEASKLSEVLSAIIVCRFYNSTKNCSEKSLNSIISLQKWCYVLNSKKIETNQISLKQEQVQSNILFFNVFVVCEVLHMWAHCIGLSAKNVMNYPNLIFKYYKNRLTEIKIYTNIYFALIHFYFFLLLYYSL